MGNDTISPNVARLSSSLQSFSLTLSTPPFGPLNGLHNHIIENAVGFTPARLALYLAPAILLYAQAYLLLAPGTRYTRAALGVIALSGMWAAWTSIRFTNPWHNAWNHVISMPYVQFMVKGIEFSLLKGPIRDPYMPERCRAVAAWDLLINSRLIGLGSVGVDNGPGIPNAKAQKGQIERHLQMTTTGWRPTSRAGSVLRHAGYAAMCYIVLDTFYQVLPRLDPVFQQPYGGQTVLEEFSSKNIVLFPDLFDIHIASWALVLACQAGIGICIWMFFEGIYQLFAVLHLLAGWPVAAWDPNMFGSMWRADSLIDLWGTRWHQTFRHMFIVASSVLLQALRIPMSGPTIFLATFFFSGAIHVASEMAMDPVGSPGSLMVFFLLSGAGCALEVVFKRATGRRVRGGWGQLWTWAYMALIGRTVASAWLASGYAGCHVTPRGGPGDYLAQVLVDNIVAQK